MWSAVLLGDRLQAGDSVCILPRGTCIRHGLHHHAPTKSESDASSASSPNPLGIRTRAVGHWILRLRISRCGLTHWQLACTGCVLPLTLHCTVAIARAVWDAPRILPLWHCHASVLVQRPLIGRKFPGLMRFTMPRETLVNHLPSLVPAPPTSRGNPLDQGAAGHEN